MFSVDKALHSPLLSPPTSPRMSAYATESPGTSWQSREAQAQGAGTYTPFSSAIEDSSRYQSPTLSDRPPLLRSHKSVPSFLEPSFSTPRSHSALGLVSELAAAQDNRDKPLASPTAHSEPSLSLETNGINSTSAHQLTTPTSPNNNDSGLEDDAGMLDVEDDEETSGTGENKTGTLSRADKRKMKRFRLTHNQTRFLMSEFSRQAHPDAAQRERLAKEIPGLSPRQVQVWFQNRRAKMKRLTADDQERMLKSRALPEDFDMSQALHSPYGGQTMMGTPLASPVSYIPPYGEAPFVRPLMIDNIRRQSDDDTTSPLSIHSSYGSNFYTPPGSDNVSPISTASDRHYGSLTSHHSSPRGPNPLLRSSSFSPGNYQPPHIPRLQIHDRVGRSRADSLHSPLRSSITYSTDSLDYGQDRRPAAEQPLSLRHEGSGSPYGLGHHNGHLPGFSSSALSRVRPIGTSIPPGLQLKSEYRSSAPTTTPHTPAFPIQQSAPLAPPHEYQFPQLSAPYHSSSFGNAPYSHHNHITSSYNGHNESTENQRQSHETSPHGQKRSPNLPIPLQTHFEIPKRSFTYDYGTSQP